MLPKKNYVRVNRFSVRYMYFCYVDTEENICERLCKKWQVRLKTGQIYAPARSKYRLIICRIKRSEYKAFQKVMQKLWKALDGYDHDSRYRKFCLEEFPEMIDDVLPYMDV